MALLRDSKDKQISSILLFGACEDFLTFFCFYFTLIEFVPGAKGMFHKVFKTSLISVLSIVCGMSLSLGSSQLQSGRRVLQKD